MLTLEEVLADAAMSPGFGNVENVGINSRGEEGQTPLHWMAVLGDAKGTRLLIEAGANVNATDDRGYTALHEAVEWRHASAVRALIDSGADVRIRNNAGKTALDMAQADGFAPTIELLQPA